MQNAFTESFNGRLRDECTNEDFFLGLREAQRTIEAWRESLQPQPIGRFRQDQEQTVRPEGSE